MSHALSVSKTACPLASDFACIGLCQANPSCFCDAQVYANLDDKLLQEFPAYLEERGIDADMGNYLLALVNDKEEREYKSWLENVQKFLKK